MSRHRLASGLAKTAIAAAWLICLGRFAVADDATYCIICKSPDQTYRCKVSGAGSRPVDALKLYCIIRTAKEGNHASCAARRDDSGCDGALKVYSYDDLPVPTNLVDNPQVQRLVGKLAKQQAAAAKAENDGGAPKTVAELTKRTVDASREKWESARAAFGHRTKEEKREMAALANNQPPPESRMQRMKHAAASAGAAVGGFARKSYHCMRSLFRSCASTAEEQAAD